MKYWEFLIQKEGDQTWLPLETQQVEILEGRYRVVAHTDRANTPVDIRVSQLATSEMPPRKRVRKRTGSTNESGLVVVMPFVHLKPGQWTLKCSSAEGIDQMLGDRWQYDVQLQVFAQSEEDGSGEWPAAQNSQSVSSVLIDQNASDEPTNEPIDKSIGEPTNEPIDESMVNADLPLLQAQAELQQTVAQGTHGESAQTQWEGPSSLAYQVTLRQQAYLSQRDQPMTIMGQVNTITDAITDALTDTLTDASGEAASQLWIRLQNPETAGVIMEAHRPLSLARLPADFKVQIQLPNDVKTRVVLGEVSLRTTAIDGERSVQVLASTAFTITAGIDQILDAIANQDSGTFDEEESLLLEANDTDLTPKREPLMPTLDLSAKTSAPVEKTVLPPQLEQRSTREPVIGESLSQLPTQIGSSLIDLPTFDPTMFDRAAVEPIPPDSPNQSADGQLNQPPDQDLAKLFAGPNSDADLLIAGGADFDKPAVEVEPQASSQYSMPPVSMPLMVSAPAQFVGTSIEDSDLEADEITSALGDIDQDLLNQSSDLDAWETPGIGEGVDNVPPRTSKMTGAETERVPDSAAPSAEEASKSSQSQLARKSGREVEANLAFQSLKLKDHFWQRLSALNRQSHEEAAKLVENMEAAGVQRFQGDGLRASSTSSAITSSPITSSAIEEYAGDEVVLYEEPPVSDQPVSNVGAEAQSETQSEGRFRPALTVNDAVNDGVNDAASRYGDRAARIRSRRDRSALPASQFTHEQAIHEGEPATAQKRPSALEEDLPEMALPVISLPVGDLVAGQTVTVTVRSRPSAYKPFIKLWMIDRQSRNLVMDPKILTNLTRDPLGDLQGTAELQVPMDCLDVQIAAIAIDMATQQESGKAVVNRRVTPANQTFLRDRFNL